jgi:hypothetical protein
LGTALTANYEQYQERAVWKSCWVPPGRKGGEIRNRFSVSLRSLEDAMQCAVSSRRSMWFCTAFAILDTDPRTKLEWGISSPFLPGSHIS